MKDLMVNVSAIASLIVIFGASFCFVWALVSDLDKYFKTKDEEEKNNNNKF